MTLSLTIVGLLALLFSSTRATGLLIAAILLCVYPLFYSAALLIGAVAYLFFIRFK